MSKSVMSWPTNEQVKNYKFGDAEVDAIKNFDYYARGALIMREITRDDYLTIEKLREFMLHNTANLSDIGKDMLREVLDNF